VIVWEKAAWVMSVGVSTSSVPEEQRAAALTSAGSRYELVQPSALPRTRPTAAGRQQAAGSLCVLSACPPDGAAGRRLGACRLVGEHRG